MVLRRTGLTAQDEERQRQLAAEAEEFGSLAVAERELRRQEAPEDTFSLVNRLFPRFPGLKPEDLDTEIERLRSLVETDTEGFLFDLSTRATSLERDAVLRAIGTGEEFITSLLTAEEQEAELTRLIADITGVESIDEFDDLLEDDPDLFLDAIQTGGDTPEKRQLLQMMGLEPLEIDNILGTQRIVVPVDGIRKLVTVGPNNRAFDEEGNFVGVYNSVTQEVEDLTFGESVSDTWDAARLAAQGALSRARGFFLSTVPNILFADAPAFKRKLYGNDWAERTNREAEKVRDFFRTKYSENNREYEQWLDTNNIDIRPDYVAGVTKNVELIKDPFYWAYEFANIAPYAVASMTAGLAAGAVSGGNPLVAMAAAGAVMLPSETEAVRQELLLNGMPEEQADLVALAAGSLIASLEGLGRLPILKAVSPAILSIFRKEASQELAQLTMASLLKKGLTVFTASEISETLTEVLQEAVGNAAVKIANEEQSIFEGLEVIAAKTAIGTAPLSLLGGGASMRRVSPSETKGLTRKELRERFEEFDGNWYEVVEELPGEIEPVVTEVVSEITPITRSQINETPMDEVRELASQKGELTLEEFAAITKEEREALISQLQNLTAELEELDAIHGAERNTERIAEIRKEIDKVEKFGNFPQLEFEYKTFILTGKVLPEFASVKQFEDLAKLPTEVAPEVVGKVTLQEVNVINERITEIEQKWEKAKTRNSALARKDLSGLRDKGVDVTEVESALDEYTSIDRADFDSAEDFGEARTDAWDEFVDSLGNIEKLEVTPDAAFELEIVPQPAFEKDVVVESAKKTFGVTTNPAEAGFILESGQLLDFSEEGERVAHEDIGRAFPEDFVLPEGENNLTVFERETNAIRYSESEVGGAVFSLTEGQTPTKKQIDRLKAITRGKVTNFDFIDSQGNIVFSEELTPATSSKIDALIERAGLQEALVEGVRIPEVPEAPVVPPVVAPTATQRVFKRIQIDPAEPGVKEKIQSGWATFNVKMIDDLYALRKFVQQIPKGDVDLSIEENPYASARLLKGITGKTNTFLEQGTFGKKFWKTVKGKAVPNYTGESLENILREVREPADWQDFSTYMVARRTVELNDRNIETGVSIDDANNAIIELESKHKNFTDLAERLNKYQDALLVYGNEMGLLSNELLEKLRKNANYVPFYRVFNELQSRGFMGKKLANIASPIKRIKGSEREIINPLESIVKNTYVLISTADRNNIGIMMANLVDQHPELAELFERVPTPITKVAQTSAKELGIEVEGMTENDMNQVVDIFRPSFFVPGNEVTVIIDGKKQFYKVDPDLRDSLLNLTREDIGAIGKILSLPAKWLRAGAILSPDFMVRNPARDQLTAFAYSNYNFLPGFDFLKGIAGVLKKDVDYQLFRQSGAEHSMLVSMDREYLQKSFKEITEGKKFTDFIKNPLELFQLASELGEKATRLGEFKKGVATGITPAEAALSAREVSLDFAKAGSTAHAVNRLIAFFNANIRGWDKMITAFREHPVRTSFKVFMGITLPSIILYIVNRDDPRWDEIPQWQKDLFWIIMTRDNIFRIPKPFELGILFGSVPERFLEWLDKRDPQLLKETLLNAAEAGSPGFIPQALLPIIENLANFNFFRGRAIVPPSRLNLPPELQYTRYTTTVSKEVGKLINVSPAKIDNLINAWTGGLGRYALNILDGILEGTGISPSIPEPSPTLADRPVIKAFVVRNPFGAQNKSVNDFYEKLEEYQANEKALKDFLKTGDIIKFNELKEKHPELLFFYDFDKDVAYSASARYLRSVARDLSELRKKQDEVFNSRTMSPEIKREKIDEIDRLKIGVVKRALALFPAEEPIVLEKQLFDASNQLGDVLNDVPLLSREKPDIYNMIDLSRDYKDTLEGVTLADLEGKKIPKTVPDWYEKEKNLSSLETFPSMQIFRINNDPKKGFIVEDFISQWRERELITDPEELRDFDKRFPSAHQGNLTPAQISALKDYHQLSGDEQKLFLDGHPELREDPRDEWLKENPEDNARLAIWGKANILTQEAYDIALTMMKELKLPLKVMPEHSLPPRESAESHVKYLEAAREFGANSAEARLILAQDDVYREWRGLDEVDVPIRALELQAKNRELDNEFDLLETDDERDLFRELHPQWVNDTRRVEAIRKDVPANLEDDYVKYYSLPVVGFDQERFLKDNQSYYNDVWLGILGNQELDFDKIPTVKFEETLTEYEKLDLGADRYAFRGNDLVFDAEGVRLGKWKPWQERKTKPKAKKEPIPKKKVPTLPKPEEKTREDILKEIEEQIRGQE